MAAAQQPLKEKLHRVIDDLDIIIRQLSEIMTIPRDQRTVGQETSVVQLVELFKIKEQELNEGMKIASQQAERQKIIEHLEDEVRKRDEYIGRIRNCFKDSEDMLINAIFQANQKLKSISEANRRKVSVDELIRYAHRISSTNAVAAPLTWQQGDPQRPYPTEVDMWVGWPERAKERTKEKEFPLAMSGMGASSSMLPGPPFPGQQPMPVVPQEMFMRPPQTSGIFPQPQITSPMGPPRGAPWMSPRGGGHGQNVSPRIMRPATPGSSGGGQQNPFVRQQQQQSPFIPTVGMQQQHHATTSPASLAIIKMENPVASATDAVEVLSSDSSSSSDSDSQ